MAVIQKSFPWARQELDTWRTHLENSKKTPKPPHHKYVILLATGCFNPPHKLHIQMFEEAQKNLEIRTQPTTVIGCLLVPSSDNYVVNKLGGHAIPFVHREALLKLIYGESRIKELFGVSKAESHYNYFYEDALVFYQKLIAQEFPEDKDNIQVKYLCGSDRGSYLSHLARVWSRDGAVVIERADEPILDCEKQHCPWMLVYPGVETEISSTALRTGGYENAHQFMVNAAVEYLKEFNLLTPCRFKGRCKGRWSTIGKCQCE